MDEGPELSCSGCLTELFGLVLKGAALGIVCIAGLAFLGTALSSGGNSEEISAFIKQYWWLFLLGALIVIGGAVRMGLHIQSLEDEDYRRW